MDSHLRQNWGARVQCCFPAKRTACNLSANKWGASHAYIRKRERVHDVAHERAGEARRVSMEGDDVCDARRPSAPAPPEGSPPHAWYSVDESSNVTHVTWREDPSLLSCRNRSLHEAVNAPMALFQGSVVGINTVC